MYRQIADRRRRRRGMASSSANLWVLLSLGFAGILFMTRILKKTNKEDFGAFVEKFQLLPLPQPAPPKAPHPLTGLTFAVSDGHVTGFGNPDWGRTHDAASHTAPVVSVLVEGGATCIGKTVVDEMAYSLSGENKHYGAPTNPASPACIPGGSSSGAAVAVASELIDFSLGIDSSGDVRVPAAFCGIIGFRTSYGAVPHVGIIPVSRSLDTVGLLAKDPNVLRRVGHVMLQLPFTTQRSPRQIIIADDCFELAKTHADRAAQVVIKSTEKLFGSLILKHEKLEEYLNSKVPGIKAFSSKKENGVVKTSSSIRSLASMMDIIKRHEFRQNHKEWVNLVKPDLDPSISTKIRETLEMSDKEIDNLLSVRHEVRSAINSLLKDDSILVVPTTMESLPPKLGAKEVLSEDYQSRVFSLLSIASMSGCCQVSVPLGFSHKYPVSVSFIARHGGDRFLLDTVNTMYKTLQEQTEITVTTKTLSNGLSPEQSAEIAKEKGNQAYKDKQWQKAISCYTDAIKLNANSATYYSNRAAVYLETGSLVQAEADCSKAINLDKKNVKAYLRRGTAREMLGFYKGAIEDFGYALVLEPTNKRASLSAQRLKKLFQ